MPTITNTTSIPTAQPTINLVAGSQYEYLPGDAHVEIGLVAETAGAFVTILAGSDTLSQEGAIPVVAANVYPKYPDDFHWADDMAAGDRLALNVRNPTAGTIKFNWVVKITWH